MISLPTGDGEDLASEMRNLRSRPRASTPDQGHGVIERTSNGDATRTEVLEHEQPAKRLKLSQETSTELTKAFGTSNGSDAPASTESNLNLREDSAPLSVKDAGEVKRRTWTLQKTKRASSLNLHNHPVISHPVGIAIWLLQKIDQARKSNTSDDERSPSTSLPASPGSIRPSTEVVMSGTRTDRSDPATAFSFKPSSLTGAQPLWGQSHVIEHEDDTARRQAQRYRKTKQRSENWAKNKENDVVARAKLEAKKKFGTQAQQEVERKRFVDERVRDDYGRLLGRQTAQFADAMAQLAPFQVGHSEQFVQSNLPHYGLHHPYVQAGKLLLDVLPALAEPQVSGRSQRAADALLSALEHGNPDEASFFTFIEVVSDDEIIQQGIDKVLGQLLSARPDDRRASRSKASPAGSQLAPPPPARTSPDSAGLSLKRLTWKEPATLKDNHFAPQANLTPSTETRLTEQPRLSSFPSDPADNMTPPPSQTDFPPRSPSLADLMPLNMPPPPPAQARSSGRERKPTAKVLAAGTETPSRQSATSPPAALRPTLTRNARSVPRIPSRLGLSEVIAEQEEDPRLSTAPTAGGLQHNLSEGTHSTVTTNITATTTITTTTADDQRPSPPISSGPLVQPVLPQSLQHLPPNTPPRPGLQPAVDPRLTANLLQLAEIAANMSESDDDDDELGLESNDLPYHERLIRVLKEQSTTSKWHIVTPNSVEQSAKSSSVAPLLSAPQLQTASAIAAPSQPTSLPPVNTIISAQQAQAASSFFKSLVAGEPGTRVLGPEPVCSATLNPHAGADTSVILAPNLHGNSPVMNGITCLGRLNAVGNTAPLPQVPGPEHQIVHTISNTLSPKTLLGVLNTSGQGSVLPLVSPPEGQAVHACHGTTSPQRALPPANKKRKFEDEGNDIAMNRLRSHAESRGLMVDPNMSFDQLNAMIDNHEKAAHYSCSRPKGPSNTPVPTVLYGNGLAMNGNVTYSSPGPTPTIERLLPVDGLPRLAPNPPWPGYSHPYPPYNVLPPRSPASQLPPLPKPLSTLDNQRVFNSHVANSCSQGIQFVPPKQPGQFSNQKSPVIEKAPAIASGDDPRHHHQKALNGGPPGGGAVINSRSSKKQQNSNTAGYKFHVNAKETPTAQSKPKRGGQLMTF